MISSSFLIIVYIVDSREAHVRLVLFRHTNENFNIFYTYKVWWIPSRLMFFWYALLSDNVKCNAFYIRNHSSLSFSMLIVLRHMRLYVYCMWMIISIFSIRTSKFDVLYLILSSSGRALLSDDKKCYDFSFHNNSASSCSSSLVVRHTRLVRSLEFHYFIYVQYYTHDVFNDTLRHSLCALTSGNKECYDFSCRHCVSLPFSSLIVVRQVRLVHFGKRIIILISSMHQLLHFLFLFHLCIMSAIEWWREM